MSQNIGNYTEITTQSNTTKDKKHEMIIAVIEENKKAKR